MKKNVIWYQQKWVIKKYRLGVISDKYSAMINIMYPLYWRVKINWDQVYFYQGLALLIFKKEWQKRLIFCEFFDLYEKFKDLTKNTSYLRYLSILNIFFYVFNKKDMRLLVDILINLSTNELIWINWMFKNYVEYLEHSWNLLELLLNIKISSEKKLQINWKLLYNLFFYYKLIEDNSNKYNLYQINVIFVWYNLYLFELFFFKLNDFILKIWWSNILFVNVSKFNVFKNKENIGFIFLLFVNFISLKNYMLNYKEVYTLKESKYFLDKITYFEFFRQITWIKLYFKLLFKLPMINK